MSGRPISVRDDKSQRGDRCRFRFRRWLSVCYTQQPRNRVSKKRPITPEVLVDSATQEFEAIFLADVGDKKPRLRSQREGSMKSRLVLAHTSVEVR